MHYLYFPFTDYKHDNAFVNTKRRYKHKYGDGDHNKHGEENNQVFIQGGKGLIGKLTKPLSVVRDNDVLIIMSHGSNVNTGTISVGLKKGRDSMIHNDLAKQLKQEGLRKTHKVIKMVSCFGGGDTRFNPNDELGHIDNTKDFFAKLLAKSLGEIGYDSIVVGGYDGVVCTSRVGGKNDIGWKLTDGSDVGDVPEGWTVGNGKVRQPTSGNCNWYDSDGKETTRPPLN